MTTLVVGARGHVGRHILDLLLTAGEPVRASARRPGTDLPAGVDVVAADLTDPGSLRPALVGVERVFLYAPAADPVIVPALVQVFGAAELERVVLLSSGSVLLASAAGNAIAEEHRTVEAAFERSAVPWIPVRPLVLATNDLHWAPAVREGRPVRLVHPDAVAAPIHERDVAAVAVAALTGTAHPGSDVSGILTGGELLDQRDRLAVVAELLGRPVTTEELTEDQARISFGRLGNAVETEAILHFLRDAAEGGSPATGTFEQVLGTKPATYREWVQDHLADFAVTRRGAART